VLIETDSSASIDAKFVNPGLCPTIISLLTLLGTAEITLSKVMGLASYKSSLTMK
jgi:hypothetical protein